MRLAPACTRAAARSVAARTLLLATGVALAARGAAAQGTLTFEDLCYHDDPSCGFVANDVRFSGGPLLNDYASFSWTNFRGLDLLNYPLLRPANDPTATGTSGYPTASPTFGNVLGLAVGEVVLRRPVGSDFGQFLVSGFDIGSGWTEGMTLGVTGSLGGQTVFTLPTITLLATMSSQLALPTLWVDQLTLTPNFTPAGYTDPYHSAEQQTGRGIADGGTPYMTFWFDNLEYQVRPAVVATPEPGTLTLLAGGLALVGALGARRRRRASRD